MFRTKDRINWSHPRCRLPKLTFASLGGQTLFGPILEERVGEEIPKKWALWWKLLEEVEEAKKQMVPPLPGQTVVCRWCWAGWQTPALHPWWSHAH